MRSRPGSQARAGLAARLCWATLIMEGPMHQLAGMFESLGRGHKVEKAVYAVERPALREALLDAQCDLLAAAKFPVVIVIAGVEAAGRGETVNLLNAWMDPRHIETNSFALPSDEELER